MTIRDPIKVLLVDDHPVVRDGYRRLLDGNSDIVVVAEAGSGEEACELYNRAKPDVVVLDLSMPGIGGLETTSRICAKHNHAKILVFSMYDSQIMVGRALEAGAIGYITKSSAATQMIDAVRSVAGGKPFLSHGVVPAIFNQFQQQQSEPLTALSKREFEVFRRLADGSSVTEIAKELSISPKTVGVHQTKIMKKLTIRNSAELTRLAIRCGVIEV